MGDGPHGKTIFFMAPMNSMRGTAKLHGYKWMYPQMERPRPENHFFELER
jgi:hypothetical protein